MDKPCDLRFKNVQISGPGAGKVRVAEYEGAGKWRVHECGVMPHALFRANFAPEGGRESRAILAAEEDMGFETVRVPKPAAPVTSPEENLAALKKRLAEDVARQSATTTEIHEPDDEESQPKLPEEESADVQDEAEPEGSEGAELGEGRGEAEAEAAPAEAVAPSRDTVTVAEAKKHIARLTSAADLRSWAEMDKRPGVQKALQKRVKQLRAGAE